MLLPALFAFALATMLPAQTCREVVRDSSGRVIQTIERQKQAGGTERAVIRDASGRSAGSETTSGNGTVTSTRRDGSGRVTENSTGTSKCQGVVRVPTPPTGLKK